MSKMGQAIFEMQEDAVELTRDEFVKKYGKQNADVWDNIDKPESDVFCYPGSDPQQ